MQPPLHADEPPYETFYGLREQPFSLTTDPRFLYLSAGHRLAFDELLTGLRRREGLLLLTGDTGTGKTTLCRAVIDALGHRAFAALILNPYMNDLEVLRTILRDFGLVTRDDIRSGAFERADLPQLLDTLEQFLRSLVPLKSYAVVIIDEAQSLSPRVLDQIRVLGSLEHEGRRLLQIMLVGQPPLVETLRSDALRALADRISRRVALAPLPHTDIPSYIHHRLAIAGAKGQLTFTPDALARLTALSDGLPRRINLLCDRALEYGRESGTTIIDAPLISRAANAFTGIVTSAHEHAAAASTPAPVELTTSAIDAPASVPSASPFDLSEPAAPTIGEMAPGDLPDLSFGHDDPAELLKDLDATTPIEEPSEPPMILEAEPAQTSGVRFWLIVGLMAAAVAAGAYYLIRSGRLHL